MTYRVLLASLVLCSAILFGCARPTGPDDGQANPEWRTETVHVVGGFAVESSLAIDSSGRPMVAYFDDGAGQVLFAGRDGDTWIGLANGSGPDTVDDTGTMAVGSGLSMALTSGDLPHLSYHDANTDDLKYARWDGDDWVGRSGSTPDWPDPDPASDEGHATSIGLDSNGDPLIAYVDVLTGSLSRDRLLRSAPPCVRDRFRRRGNGGLHTVDRNRMARPRLGVWSGRSRQWRRGWIRSVTRARYAGAAGDQLLRLWQSRVEASPNGVESPGTISTSAAAAWGCLARAATR